MTLDDLAAAHAAIKRLPWSEPTLVDVFAVPDCERATDVRVALVVGTRRHDKWFKVK